jgi:ABC-2 type transport system ATP-binding protein
MTVIRTEGLWKSYGSGWWGQPADAVRGLSFEVRAGEVFGFLGPNGAGKTTTIHLLLNFIRPSAGAAFLFDRPVSDPAARVRVGYLPESVNLHDYYRGGRLLEFYGALLDMPRQLRERRAAELLALLGLQDAAQRPVSKYSKGMLQRIGFAQALLGDPELLVLDEPTSSLDPVGRKEFRDILLELKRRGKTVFISSHILSEVESVCDRVAILQNGRLRKVGSLQELSRGAGATIVLQRLPAAALEALAALSARVTMEQGQVSIQCPDQAVRQQVEDLLASHQVEVLRVEAATQSLEDIFFSAITPESAS